MIPSPNGFKNISQYKLDLLYLSLNFSLLIKNLNQRPFLYIAIYSNTFLYILIHSNTFLYISIHSYTFQYIPLYSNNIFQVRSSKFCMVVDLDHSYTLLYIPIHSYTFLYIPIYSFIFQYNFSS